MDEQELQPIDNPTAVKIIDAAAQLFMQRGYKAVSITDIIQAAKITKPTLYYYFADKEELYTQMGLRVLATMGSEMHAALAGQHNTADRLRALAASISTQRERDTRMMRREMFEHLGLRQRTRLAHAFYRQLFAPVAAVMDEGIARGDLARYSAHTLATMFLGMAEAFQDYSDTSHNEQWATESQLPIIEQTVDVEQMVDLFLHGVGTKPPARQ